MSKKVIGALAAALVLAILPMTALAAENSTEGGNSMREEYEEREVEPGQGSAATEEDGPFFSNPESCVLLGDGTEYDKDSQLYLIRLGASRIYAEAPDGVIQKGSVYICKVNASDLHLFRSSEEITFDEDITVSDPGDYSLVKGTGDGTQRVLHFTIVTDLSGVVTGYQMPYGFVITSAKRNGEDVETDGKYISFLTEGTYDVDYENTEIGVGRHLTITTDFTEPTLLLADVNEKGYASGPVSLEDWNKSDTIQILQNGKEVVMPYNYILTESGTYQITVTDPAGNSSIYSFVIRPYLNVSAAFVVALGVVILVGLIVFVVRTRKYMRVR